MTLLFVSTFALMTAAVGNLVSNQINNVNKAGIEKRTKYAAYGAIQYALQRLNQDRFWDPVEALTDVPIDGDPAIRWTLRVYNNWGGTFSNPAPDGVWVPKYMVYLKAQGDLGGSPGDVSRRVWPAWASSGTATSTTPPPARPASV